MNPCQAPHLWRSLATLGLFSLLVADPAVAQFDLIINTTGASSAQQEQIDLAEALWEDVIAGYQANISISRVIINLSFSELGGGTLGLAGPTSTVNQGGFRLSTAGFINLDNGLGLGSIKNVTAHEIGHVIGIGTLWDDNGVYVNGSGQYTGEFGLAAYREEFDANATFIPVELNGGSGTANSHWDESGFFANELMSGYLSGSNFLSFTTIGHLRDLGFDTIGGITELTGVDGDVNQDGLLNSFDVDAFVLGWRSTTIGLNAVERTMLGDLNLSGETDLTDATILYDAIATSGSGILGDLSVIVPEPGALMLAMVAVSTCCMKRRTYRFSVYKRST